MNPEKLTKITFFLIFLFSINYLPLILKVPFSFFNNDFRNMNIYSRKLQILEQKAGFLKQEKEVGFISEVKDDNIMLLSDPILNFYIAQYALTPAIVKKGSEFPYTVGIYDKIVRIDKGLSIYRQLSPDIFVFKRSEK